MAFRELDLGLNVLHSNIGRLPHPYKLTHAVTYKCNSRCSMCGIWKRKPEKEFSLGEMDEFYRKSNRFNWISITGGEIFLREDIVDVVESISKNCSRLYTLTFPTNGLLTDRIDGCVRDMTSRIRQKIIITVSLDGPPELHDRIRGVPGGWSKAVETFRRLREIRKVEAYFGMTLSAENIGRLDETLASVMEEIPSVKPRDFHLNIAHSSSHFYQNPGADEYPPEAAANEVREFRKKKGWLSPVLFLEQKYLSLVPNYLNSGATPLPCKAASASCFIDPQGTVYPCTMWDKPLGSLRDVGFDLKKLWDTSEFKKTAQDALNKKCPNCWTPCEAYQTILGNLLHL